ncbi:MAG: ABC transporter ATP-binding protein/permease [Eubacterium sp.]|nr:ABC transporter ATP-binding protein/permease [Eubacterium sp.]
MLNDLKSSGEILRKLNRILTKQQKRYTILIFVMTLIGSVFETLGVSIILPLVQAMIEPEKLLGNIYVAKIAELFKWNDSLNLVKFLCICTIILYCVKNIYMCLFTYAKTKFTNKIGRELATKILTAYTRREYTFFLNYSSGECLRDIGTDASGVATVLNNGFGLLAECITIAMIITYIFIVNYQMALVVIVIAGVCLVLVLKIFRNLCKEWGEKTRKYGERIFKYSMELFRGIKEIKILGRERFFISNYESVSAKQNGIASKYALSLSSPAYIIEALFVSGFLLFLCLGSGVSNNMMSIVPQLSAFAIAAFRVLPSLGKISSGINNIIYAVPMVNASYLHITDIENGNVIQEEKADYFEKIEFDKEISINNISWQYPNTDKKIIENLSMKIEKGTSVAFIGTSGAGKTTLADIILGLLKPQEGTVTLDGKDIRELGKVWSTLLGYVPQAAYLIDDSIKRNVAFGLEDENIDNDKVWYALEQAQLKDFVESLPQSIDTEIGESGVRFSGGQRQRLAIARALYNDPQILVLDEATSALDSDTEKALIDAIEKLQGEKTMIVVAHRLTTVRNCDIIYEIKDGIAIQKDKREIFGKEI